MQLRIDLTTLATERGFDRASALLLDSAWFQSTIRKNTCCAQLTQKQPVLDSQGVNGEDGWRTHPQDESLAVSS